MDTESIYKLYDELKKVDLIKDNYAAMVNTLDATKRFNLKRLLKAAYKNKMIRDAFEKGTEGLIFHFKLNKDAKKSKNVEEIDFKPIVEKILMKIFPGKFTHFEAFDVNIGGSRFWNVVCF